MTLIQDEQASISLSQGNAMSTPVADSNPSEEDERLGEAIEAYLTLVESGDAPDPEGFASRYPELEAELLEAFEGLALVRGLVGDSRGESGSLKAGRRVAGYRIVRELGRGGMGIVYEAVHVDLDRPVALKVLGHAATPDSNSRQRFLNEAKTAAGLHHTYIVPVFDVGQVGSLCYYAMQRIEGTGLDRVIKLLKQTRNASGVDTPSNPRQTPRTAVTEPLASGQETTSASRSGPASRPSLTDATASWSQSGSRAFRGRTRAPSDEDATPPFNPPSGAGFFRWVALAGKQAAEGLAYAHRRGVIHRDIKPSNLLMDERGNTWIADFGLASRTSDQVPGHAHSAGPVGTPRYMSPEQAAAGPVDPRTDLYSLGATLYEILTLKPPFDGDSSSKVIEQIRANDPVPPRQIVPRAPKDLEAIILKAMAKRPEDRYESSEAMADDLTRFLASEPVSARPLGPTGRLVRFTRRHPFSSTISTSAAAIVLTIATWAYLRVYNERNSAITAQEQTAAAMEQARAATRRSEAARAQQLWREATVIRLSALPERRTEGLNRLRESATLSSDPDLRARLREEAVAFLAIRDVEPLPALQTGPNWGTVFTPGAHPASLATLAEDGESISIRRLDNGQQIQRLELPHLDRRRRDQSGPPLWPMNRGGQRPLPGIAPSGSFLATIWPNGQGLRLIEPRTGTIHAEMFLPDRQIEGILATPDGRRLITLERAGGAPASAGSARSSRQGGMVFPSIRAVLWDTANLAGPLATIAEPVVSEANPLAGRFPDIPVVAVGPGSQEIAQTWVQFQPRESGSTIALFAADTGAETSQITGVPGTITALALGRDHLLAAALSDGSIRIWEGISHASLPGLYHHQTTVRNLTFSPDGGLLALAGGSTGIEVWDVATNTLVAALQAPSAVSSLKFSPDGKTLAATTNSVIAHWQIIEPVGQSALTGFDGRISSVAFGPTSTLAVSDWAGQSRLWSPTEGPSMGRSVAGPRETGPLIFDDQGKLLSINAEGLDRRPFELLATTTALRFSDAVPVSRQPLDPPTLSQIAIMVQPPSLSGGAALVAQGAMQDAFRRTQMRRTPAWITYAQADSGKRLALARGGEIFLWNTDRPVILHRLMMPENERIPGAPENDRPRSGGRRGRPEGGPRPGPPDSGSGPRPGNNGSRPSRGPWGWMALALDQSGSALYLLDAEGVLHAWTLSESADGLIVATPQPWSVPEQKYTGLAFSPDQRWLACGKNDGQVDLLDPISGTIRTSITRTGTSSEARGRITALAFSPDSRTLAVGDQAGTLELWSLPGSNLPMMTAPEPSIRMLKFPPHVGSVGPIAFDRSGRFLASAGDDKIVQIWGLDQIEQNFENLHLNWTRPVTRPSSAQP